VLVVPEVEYLEPAFDRPGIPLGWSCKTFRRRPSLCGATPTRIESLPAPVSLTRFRYVKYMWTPSSLRAAPWIATRSELHSMRDCAAQPVCLIRCEAPNRSLISRKLKPVARSLTSRRRPLRFGCGPLGNSHHSLYFHRAQLPAFRAEEGRSGHAVPDRHPVLGGVLLPTLNALLSVLDHLAVLADNNRTLDGHRTPLLRLMRAWWWTDRRRFLFEELVGVSPQRGGRFRGIAGLLFSLGEGRRAYRGFGRRCDIGEQFCRGRLWSRINEGRPVPRLGRGQRWRRR